LRHFGPERTSLGLRLASGIQMDGVVPSEGLVEERGWGYRRRQPEGTVLYEAVRDNLATLLAEASEVGRGLPWFVERDFAWLGGEVNEAPGPQCWGPEAFVRVRGRDETRSRTPDRAAAAACVA
jgi:hypothetical protein